MNDQTGIYKITNTINNKCYIGSAKNFRRRKIKHLYELKYNKHHSILLQRSWNKYGKENFIFELIEECECKKDVLITREQWYIDNFHPEFNICKIAGSCIGIKHTEKQNKNKSTRQKGRVCSEETKERISIKLKGRATSEETRKKLSESLKGKPKSKEHLENLSKSLKGRKSWNKGLLKQLPNSNEKSSKNNYRRPISGR